jgi:3-phosphoshikimate 1-carboxyvinyltransferase
MLTAIIQPSSLKGAVRIPASKSISQRALALALLHPGITRLSHVGESRDERQVLEIIKTLGAVVTNMHDQVLEIRGRDEIKPGVCLDCGESALAARMFTCLAALAPQKIMITGSGSLMHRPMDELVKMLSPRVDFLRTKEGMLPFEICGPLKDSDQSIDAGSGSQHVTGLIMALACSVSNEKQIEVCNLVSKPYLDLTISLLDSFGCRVEHTDYRHFTIYPKILMQDPVHLEIEGDWSNAAFWVVAGALNGSLMLKGLSLESVQGDRVILDLAKLVGVTISVSGQGLTVHRSDILQPFEFDAKDHPDLFPPLSILAASIDGISKIAGVHRLRGKESDRALSIVHMLRQLGVKAELKGDDMLIYGGRIIGGSVDSYGDHRIAMAAAIAAINAEGPVTISRAEAVEKSYPTFFRHLSDLGASLSLSNQNQNQ